MASLLRRRIFNATVTRARHGSRGWDWYYKALEKEKEAPKSPHVLHYKPLKADHVRPRAFLDFAAGEEQLGRVVIELADDIVPKTVDNFVQLCTGSGSSGYSYKGNKILAVVPNHVIATGDVTDSKDGKDGHGAEEKCVLNCFPRCIVSMYGVALTSCVLAKTGSFLTKTSFWAIRREASSV